VFAKVKMGYLFGSNFGMDFAKLPVFANKDV